MSESKDLKIQTRLSSLLDPDTLKVISIPKAVRLHYSKWANSQMYPGKVQIPENSCDSILWTYPKELQKNSIHLASLKSGRILTGHEAKTFIQTTVLNFEKADELNSLVINGSESFSIVFEDESHCAKWTKALKVLIKAMNLPISFEERRSGSTPLDCSYTGDQYGAIFDIAELEENDIWQTIKITFVKEDSSQTDHLNFDRSQQNLYDSANEILSSMEQYLDLTNTHILNDFLRDIIRKEYIKRIERSDSVYLLKKLPPPGLKFKRRENTQIRGSYGELKGAEIGGNLIKYMKEYENNDYGDKLTDAFQVIYMQKIVTAIDLHQLACEHLISAMRKSLDYTSLIKPEESKKVRRSESPNDTENRINEIMTKKEPEKSEKSFFREPCECLII